MPVDCGRPEEADAQPYMTPADGFSDCDADKRLQSAGKGACNGADAVLYYRLLVCEHVERVGKPTLSF